MQQAIENVPIVCKISDNQFSSLSLIDEHKINGLVNNYLTL